MSKQDGILDLVVKKVWFDKIKSGEKTHEYRNAAIWKDKLGGEKRERYNLVRFRNGQTVKATDEKRVLIFRIISVKLINGKDTDLHVNHDVYDIEFETIKG